MNRVNVVEFNKEHHGDDDFPYDAYDLALYLLDRLKQHERMQAH